MCDASVKAYVRIPDKVNLLEGVPTPKPGQLTDVEASSIISSTNGKYVALTNSASVEVYFLQTSEKAVSIPCKSAYLVAFSPQSNYLVTCQKTSKSSDGQLLKNLQVWDLASGSVVLGLNQRTVSRDAWPMLHWLHDDSAVMHMVTNTIHVYSRSDNFSAYRKVSVPGVNTLAVSPAAAPLLAAFMKEVKGSPAAALVLDPSQATPQPIVRRSFFRSTGAQMLWNSKGTAVLAVAYSETDATNQSYYGEQQLHYLPADASRSDAACRVELKDGPVHDVQWSPSGEYFVVVAGFMPAKVVVLNDKCKPMYDLGSGPYNLVRWNPFGRFFAIAGFGNLPGDVVFFDQKRDGACKQMGAVRSPAVDCSWSPDGRYLLTAVTAPRLRVDNALKVFTYYGKQVHEEKFDILLDAGWLPAPPGTFQDRPQSPERLAASAGNPSSSGKAQTAPEPKGYVPPHLRGNPAAAAAASARFSLARDEDDTRGRITTQKAGPPGAEFVSKASSKNAKKRAAKKKKEGGAGDEDAGSGAAAGEVAAATQQMAAASVQDGAQEGGQVDPAKKVRALQKKLRQVQQLKEKLAAQGPSALEPEQLQKIEAEGALIAEIQQLGGTV